jgi:hypothetical protein
MTVLADVKAALRITNADSDVLLTRLIDSAARECAQFIYGSVPNYLDVDAQDDPLTVPDLLQGIALMVQADYDGDPVKRNAYRDAALNLWWPYRIDVGI